MKLPLTSAVFFALASSALVTGCNNLNSTSTEAPVSASRAGNRAPKPAPGAGDQSPAATMEAAATPAPAPLPDAVLAVIEHLSQAVPVDALPHTLADTTGFPAALESLAPGATAPKVDYTDAGSQPPPKGLTADGTSTNLVVRDWTGLVLVPINASLSKAYTSAVRLIKVEAHPLRDGRVRIWIRLENLSREPFASEIACAFRMQNDPSAASAPSPYFYQLGMPNGKYRDVFFVSPEGVLNSYTVLVRPSRSH